MEIPLDLQEFKLEVREKESMQMIIESDFFYQTSEPIENLLISEAYIRINNIKIAIGKIKIYKKNNEWYLTNSLNNLKIIIY